MKKEKQHRSSFNLLASKGNGHLQLDASQLPGEKGEGGIPTEKPHKTKGITKIGSASIPLQLKHGHDI
jgi:hypothetical protein